MGYYGKLEEKFLAQSLRKQGFSYREIVKKVNVSKDTISRWCKDIELSNEQKLILKNDKKRGQLKGSLIAASKKSEIKNQMLIEIKKIGKKEIGKLSVRDEFLVGIALYAGEGTKMDGKGAFTNSNPSLLHFMKRWFITFAKIKPENLRVRIWLHNGLDINESKKYWSELLNIPENQFIKSYISKSTTNYTKNLHNFGICSIIFYDTNAHRRIMSWISAVFNDKMAIYSAIAQR